MKFEKITIFQAIDRLIENEGVWIIYDNNLVEVNAIYVTNGGDIEITYFGSYSLQISASDENLRFYKKTIDK